uniref:Uncharacterized protein n=1 Tax=uncultured bacterium fosmid pJB83B9 TaxID=1478070 RepID=A0A0H3U850_9BACT|nr:hypothetical protein [uncultured bacterium fosmid pJB83B9]
MKSRFQPEEGWVLPADGIEIEKCGVDINVRFLESVIEEGQPLQVECEELNLRHPLFYGDLVSAIIRSRYSDDSMQAIINNHLLGDEDPEHLHAYQEMQDWRVTAKAQAKLILNKLDN